MTADLYASALAAIEARRELVGAGTPGGEWVCLPDTHAGRVWISRKAKGLLRGVIFEPLFQARDTSEYETREADAAKAVAAVNDYPRLLDALAAVLERHAPDVGYLVSGWSCAWCSDDESRIEATWPCPDAQSALTALAVTS